MLVNFRGSIIGLLRWQWKAATFFFIAATVVVALDAFGAPLIHVPAFPLAVVGGAIGIFASFRSNSGYDRWWEGRKLWGGMVNTSRHFATQVLTYIEDRPPGGTAVKHELVRRHIAYVHTLRALLRRQDPMKDDDVVAFLSEEERRDMAQESNLTHALLHKQQQQLVALANAGVLDAFRLQKLDDSIKRLLDIQGGCERIANTPFPPGYGYLADRLVLALGLLLPFGLVESLGWFTILINLIVCLGFRLISEVGRTLETPFSMFWPALALSAISRAIEINLRQRLGETDLPPPLQPTGRGVLM